MVSTGDQTRHETWERMLLVREALSIGQDRGKLELRMELHEGSTETEDYSDKDEVSLQMK